MHPSLKHNVQVLLSELGSLALESWFVLWVHVRQMGVHARSTPQSAPETIMWPVETISNGLGRGNDLVGGKNSLLRLKSWILVLGSVWSWAEPFCSLSIFPLIY